MNEFIRSFDAAIDDVNMADRTVVARINARTLDRYNSVIDPKGANFAAYRRNPIVLWEHGKDPRRFTDPIGRNLWVRHSGGETPTAILGKTQFATDEFSQQRLEWYRDGFLNAFSVRAIPTEYGPPTEDEIRAWPELDNGRPNETRGAFDGALMYRAWDLAEYSGTAVPGNADCVVARRAAQMLDLVSRGLLWLPDDVRPVIEERARAEAVESGPETSEEQDAAEPVITPATITIREALEGVARRIVKKGGKFWVYSEDGSKRLGGPYGSRKGAEKRLQQVEYFKHKAHGQDHGRCAPAPVAATRTGPWIETDGQTWTVFLAPGHVVARSDDARIAEQARLFLMQPIRSFEQRHFEAMQTLRSDMAEFRQDIADLVRLYTTGAV